MLSEGISTTSKKVKPHVPEMPTFVLEVRMFGRRGGRKEKEEGEESCLQIEGMQGTFAKVGVRRTECHTGGGTCCDRFASV